MYCNKTLYQAILLVTLTRISADLHIDTYKVHFKSQNYILLVFVATTISQHYKCFVLKPDSIPSHTLGDFLSYSLALMMLIGFILCIATIVANDCG